MAARARGTQGLWLWVGAREEGGLPGWLGGETRGVPLWLRTVAVWDGGCRQGRAGGMAGQGRGRAVPGRCRKLVVGRGKAKKKKKKKRGWKHTVD